VVSDPLAGISDGRDQPSISGEPVSAPEGTQISHGDQKLGSEDQRPMPGRLARIRASGRAKKRLCSSSSMLSMRFLRARISPASSATMREASSSVGRATLWDLAAVSALCATLLDRPLDATVSKIGSNTFMARSSKLRGSLVVSEEGEGTFAVQIQRSL